MVENRILRENARKQLGGGIFKEQWLMMLVACIIPSAINGGASATGIGAIVTLIIGGALLYGSARVMMQVIRSHRSKADLGELFCGFKEGFADTLVLYLLQNLFIALWMLLFIIPGIVKSYSYSMAFYLQQDNADKNWKTNLDLSREMMDGHKMQLFLLDLSFIGWYVLGMLCLGIGTLFVIPYHQMARSNFYEALRAHNGMDN